MSTRLVNLEVDEVSSCAKGAGRDCRVLLKKNDERIDQMTQLRIGKSIEEVLGVPYRARRAYDMVCKGQLSEWSYGLEMQRLAKQLFPTAKSSEVMSLFLDSDAGKVMTQPRPLVTRNDNERLMMVEKVLEPDAKSVRPGEENPNMGKPTAADSDQGDINRYGWNDDTHQQKPVPHNSVRAGVHPDILAHQSPHYANLVRMAEEFQQTPEGKGMKGPVAFHHVATTTDAGRDLLTADKDWHQMRMMSMRAQAGV
jgi:hypothetical protein